MTTLSQALTNPSSAGTLGEVIGRTISRVIVTLGSHAFSFPPRTGI